VNLYAGTTEQFRTDARMHRIAEKLRAEYTTQIGHQPAPFAVASWQNSLMALSMLVDQAELNDHGVILEYQLGNTSRRLDAMLTGHSPTSAEKAVVVELEQWSEVSTDQSSTREYEAMSRSSVLTSRSSVSQPGSSRRFRIRRESSISAAASGSQAPWTSGTEIWMPSSEMM